MSPLRSLFALLLVSTAARADTAFDQVLANAQLWSLDQDAFQKSTPGLPFEWTSNMRDSARASNDGRKFGSSGGGNMTLFGRPVSEVIGRFQSNKLSMVTSSFYARGDSGDLPEPAFKTLLSETIEAINKATGQKPTVRGKDQTNAVKADGLIWTTQKSQYLLEYSFTREVKSRNIPFRAEYVRLDVTPAQQKSSLLAASLATSAANSKGVRFNGPSHVKRDAASGDVWITDVPMVDQGQKGYCVVASTERVMRYYGVDVDANELAQVANSSADGGTSQEAMKEAMKKLATRLRVRVREHESLEVKGILSMIKDYNRVAKREGESEIPDQGYLLDVPRIYHAMKGPVLKEARTKNKSDLSRFQREIQAHIDAGTPLLWSVQLGLFPEPGVPQSGGGHMRLIIGYNSKTQEILFSDSWGAGHELKRKSAEEAWTITTQLVSIEPQS